MKNFLKLLFTLLVFCQAAQAQVYPERDWVALNLTFANATAKIIPGTTSLSIRNNADSATNLGITDAGLITVRNNITSSLTTGTTIVGTGTAGFWKMAGGATATVADGGFINVYGNTQANIGSVYMFSGNAAGSLITMELGSATSLWAVRNSSGGNFWSIPAASGTLTESATNGGGITLAKIGTTIALTATGQTLAVDSGTAASACKGTTTANGTTAVTVSTTCAATGAIVIAQRTSVVAAGVTEPGCWTTNIVNGTSFDLDCNDAAENSTFAWWILKEG